MVRATLDMEGFWAGQAFMDHLGARLAEWGEGYGRVALRVEGRHLNNSGTVHGGVILALADGAFSIAGATLALAGVAAQVNLHILAPAREGDELLAEAKVIHSGRRSFVVELTVSDEQGKLVARGTGLAIRLGDGRGRRSDSGPGVE